MKVEQLKLSLTKIEEDVDKDGYVCLRCRGFSKYKFEWQGKIRKGYDQFTTIYLSPVSQEQLDETKRRFYEGRKTEGEGRLNIVCYENEVHTNYANGKICVALYSYKYDFNSKKLYRKKDLLERKEGE